MDLRDAVCEGHGRRVHTVVPPAPAVSEPMLTTVVEPAAPPVPRFTVLVAPLSVAPVPTP